MTRPMPKYFHVVHFIDEQGMCDIVHTNWLQSNTTTLWPNNASERKISLHSGTFKKDWGIVNIRILYSVEDYLTASNKLKLYVDGGATTELQSDTDNEKRKQISRVRRQRKESSDSETEEPSHYKRKLKFPDFKNKPNSKVGRSCSQSSSIDSIDSIEDNLSSAGSFNSINTEVNKMTILKTSTISQPEGSSEMNVYNLNAFGSNCDSLPHPSQKMGETSIKTSSSTVGNCSELLSTLLKTVDILKHMIEKVLIQQQYLRDDNMEIRKELSLALGNTNVDSEVLLLLPIQTKDSFEMVHIILENERESKKLVQWLASKCGKQRDGIVEQCLLEIIHNQFSAICNFTGANGKLKIDGSWIIKTINAVLFKIGVSITQKEMKISVQTHLKKQYDTYFQKARRARQTTKEPETVEQNSNSVLVNDEC